MIYCYQCTCGKKVEVVKPMAEIDRVELCPICQFVMTRDFVAEHGGKRQVRGDIWPMVSDAAGINPGQVEEYRKYDREMGIPTEYKDNESPVFTSRSHRKKYLAAHHLHDRNGSYGD